MPLSKPRRRSRQSKPSTKQALAHHQTETAEQPKLCRVIYARLVAILRELLGWPPRLRMFRAIVLLAAFWVSSAASVLFFFPRITVEPSASYDPSSPSAVTFTISNANIVPLRDVQVAIGIGSMALSPRLILKGVASEGVPATFLKPPDNWTAKWLNPDEKWQISLEDEFVGFQPIENADITIAVTYSPWFVPFWRPTKQFRFIARKLSDRKIYWIPTPLYR